MFYEPHHLIAISYLCTEAKNGETKQKLPDFWKF